MNHHTETHTHYKQQLQRTFGADLKQLSKVDSVKGLSNVAFDWIVIFLAMASCFWLPHLLVYTLAAIVIAARQHALLIIMHDASHYRLVASKNLNDKLSNLFLAYPMLIRTESYRKNHLAHHRHTNTAHDPDWIRKADNSDWEFPKTRTQLFAMLFRDLIGGGFIATLKAIYSLNEGGNTHNSSASPSSKLGLIVFWGVVFTVTALTGTWTCLLLWFIPAWTVLPVLLRVRSIAEHFGLDHTHELNDSRNYHCNWLESTFLAPHNVGYHLDHHLFPSVPFYNLPEFHSKLMTDDTYASLSHQSDGIFGSRRASVERDIAPKKSPAKQLVPNRTLRNHAPVIRD